MCESKTQHFNLFQRGKTQNMSRQYENGPDHEKLHTKVMQSEVAYAYNCVNLDFVFCIQGGLVSPTTKILDHKMCQQSY